MKYKVTFTADLEIEAENVAQAFAEAQHLDVSHRRIPPDSAPKFIVHGTRSLPNSKDRMSYSIKKLSLRFRISR